MLRTKNNPKTAEVTAKIWRVLRQEDFAHEEAQLYGCYECGSMIHRNSINAIAQILEDADMSLTDYFSDLASRGITYKWIYTHGLLGMLDQLIVPYDSEDRAIGQILKTMPTNYVQTQIINAEVPF